MTACGLRWKWSSLASDFRLWPVTATTFAISKTSRPTSAQVLLAMTLCLSVCRSVCVCQKSVFYRNGWSNRAGFSHGSFLPGKERVLSSGNLSEIPDLESFDRCSLSQVIVKLCLQHDSISDSWFLSYLEQYVLGLRTSLLLLLSRIEARLWKLDSQKEWRNTSWRRWDERSEKDSAGFTDGKENKWVGC